VTEYAAVVIVVIQPLEVGTNASVIPQKKARFGPESLDDSKSHLHWEEHENNQTEWGMLNAGYSVICVSVLNCEIRRI